MPDRKAPPPNPLETYRSAVSADPKSAEARCNLGWGYYGQGKYDDAINEFQEALKLDMNTVDAYYGLGLAHKGREAKAEAMAAFEKAAVLASQSPDRVRAQMLVRLIHGQLNELKTGDWGLAKELYHREP